MKHWINTLDKLPEENKVVTAIIDDGTSDLYVCFAKVIDWERERWATVDYSIYGEPVECETREFVLYWMDTGLDGLEQSIRSLRKSEESANEKNDKTPRILVRNKTTGDYHIIGSDTNDMILVNKKGGLQYINLKRNETTGSEGNCEFVASFDKGDD